MRVIVGLQEMVRKVKDPDTEKTVMVTNFQVLTMPLSVVPHAEMNLVSEGYLMGQ